MNNTAGRGALHVCLAALLLLLACACAAAEDNALLISEAQSNNDTDWALGFRDYIELHNGGDSAVMLSDYFLTLDEADPFACHLPAVELAPDGDALLICDVDLRGLRLPKEGCSLFLFDRDGTLCDSAVLPAMENNVWQAEWGLTRQPSPGYANTEQGAAAYRASLAAQQTLVVSEVVSSNSTLLELNGETNDLIELQNIGSQTISLSDYYLSDKKKNPFLWQLPDVQLEPGACYVVQASGSGNGQEAPFKVSSAGERLYISDRNGQCVDALYVPPLPSDTSYGRSGDALCYFEVPSIGTPNPDGASGITDTPQASLDSGAVRTPETVTLHGEGAIYYTLDGRTPTHSSSRYDGTPIQIADSCVLRVRALAEGKLWSDTATYHYLTDAQKYELPLLCISGEPGAILGSNGIYTLYENRSREAAINLTLIEDGKTAFSVDCGLKIHGRGSRELKKKSFSVRFRARYGTARLEYPLFDDTPVTSFDSLVLRSGSEDAGRAFFRDEFLTSLTAQTMPEVLYQRHRPVNLFIDGAYFGVYYIRERASDAYAADYLGGEAEDVDMIYGWTKQEYGDRGDWMALLQYCETHDLSRQEHFDYVASQLCLESFMDYYIARAYSGDRDYANIRHVRSRGGDGLWRIVNFDLDWGFGSQPAALHQMIGPVSETAALNTVVINALLENQQFRDQMLLRLAWHLANTYAPERVLARIDAMEAEVAHDLRYNHERWHVSYPSWQEHVRFLRDFVSSEESDRVADMVQSARRAFRLSDEEMTRYFGDLASGQ
ncbi:MAG: CotH kinase family protein [Candidatus Ventricola sp.]